MNLALPQRHLSAVARQQTISKPTSVLSRCLAAVLVLLGPALAAAQPNSLGPASVETRVSLIEAELIEMRHDLHRHPELSGHEARTAALVARQLQAYGLAVTTNVGGHGVVGVLRGNQPGRVVAYRADMDAMPSDAPDPSPFRSETAGVRHICGHDVHTVVALGLANTLAALRQKWSGTVKFIFQPAEERMQGAKEMLGEHVLDDPRPEAIFALHTAPFTVGQIGCPLGMALPGFDLARVRLSGDGDLAAAARTLVERIQALSTIQGGPPAPLRDFISTQVDPGKLKNGHWPLEAVIRASSEANYAKAKRTVREAVAVLSTNGVQAQLDYQDRRLPDVLNNRDLVEGAAGSIQRHLGKNAALVYDGTVPTFGEDFAFYQKEIPGALLFLGVSDPPRGIIGVPHSDGYQADDGSLRVGVLAMAHVLLDFMSGSSAVPTAATSAVTR
jgi:metal-dependent amidase/aminoacylase/carboxypeptidase family protein